MAKAESARSADINEQMSYRERHALLKAAFPKVSRLPPLDAFVKHTLPFQRTVGEKEIVFAKALALKREYSQTFWKRKTEKLGLTEEERRDFQVVFIPPSREKNGDRDFTKQLYAELEKKNLGKYPPAKLVKGERYRNDPFEAPYKIENFHRAKSVYIVTSPLSKGDFTDIAMVAQEYRRLGAKEVILVSPFMSDQRDDKNVGKTKPGEPYVYNGRIIKMFAHMSTLQGSVDKIINFEPHSSAAQAIAALYGIPLAPISYEEELIGQIGHRLRKTRKGIFDPEMWKVVRPDEGRNLVATRVEERFGIEGIHLEQVRNSDTLKKGVSNGAENLKAKLNGRNVILYDDEAGTFGTIKNVVYELVPAGVREINIFLGHARLQDGWTDNLNRIIKKCRKNNVSLKVYVTNSRVPIGGLKDYMEREENRGVIKMVSVANKVREAIMASVDNVDFAEETDYHGINYERQYLQFHKGEIHLEE